MSIYLFLKTMKIPISWLLAKPSNQVLHCFHSKGKKCFKSNSKLTTGILQVNRIKIGEERISMTRVNYFSFQRSCGIQKFLSINVFDRGLYGPPSRSNCPKDPNASRGGGGVRTRTSKETTCDFPGGVGGEGEKNKAKKDLVRKLFVLFCKVTGYSLLISGTQPDIYYI